MMLERKAPPALTATASKALVSLAKGTFFSNQALSGRKNPCSPIGVAHLTAGTQRPSSAPRALPDLLSYFHPRACGPFEPSRQST